MTQRILNTEAAKKAGQKVMVCGWVETVRSHGKILFIDLRDRSGILQIIFTPEKQDLYQLVQKIRPEWVLAVEGEIFKRPDGTTNPNIPTGEIELHPDKVEIYSQAKTLPFPIDTPGYEINEEKRLRYRYLDLRRKRLQRNLMIRQEVIHFIRSFMIKEGFIEIETPILTKSTPEGARDFVVPARLEPGKFYALPQSPQQYKQMLMVSGIEKYFQVVRCLRDEDPRADRQAEHTQLDIEMAFTSQEEVLDLIERLYVSLVKKIFPEKKIQETTFPRITYEEAIKKYGTDKPDLRKDKTDANELAFCFVVDFPMFEWHEEEKAWGAMHHPFTKPQTDDVAMIKKYPEKIIAFQYDFVLNGYEIAGGSVRSTNTDILLGVFEVLGHNPQKVMDDFKHYFEAFSYGVPPHAGIAQGIDRFLAIVLNEPNIREVIAFPKTGDNRDLMMDVPSIITEDQLKELHIKVSNNKGKEHKK